MAIKVQIGKLKLPDPLDQFLADHLSKNGILLLSIEFSHAVAINTLPEGYFVGGDKHKDPCDRLIVSQAIQEGIPLISKETVFDQYGVTRHW